MKLNRQHAISVIAPLFLVSQVLAADGWTDLPPVQPPPPVPSDPMDQRMNQLLTGTENGTGAGGLAGMEAQWQQKRIELDRAKSAYAAASTAYGQTLAKLEKLNNDRLVDHGNNIARVAAKDKGELAGMGTAAMTEAQFKAQQAALNAQLATQSAVMATARANFDRLTAELNALSGQISVVKDNARNINKGRGKDEEAGLPKPKDRTLPGFTRSRFDPEDESKTDRTDLRNNRAGSRPSSTGMHGTPGCPDGM